MKIADAPNVLVLDPAVVTAVSYKIRNLQLCKVYSLLDSTRYENVAKSSLSMPARGYINYNISTVSRINNLIYNIGE